MGNSRVNDLRKVDAKRCNLSKDESQNNGCPREDLREKKGGIVGISRLNERNAGNSIIHGSGGIENGGEVPPDAEKKQRTI